MLPFNLKKTHFKAFTLPELLIVLVIIGILVLLALPRLSPLISRAKSTEAQLQLKHVYDLEKNYFYLKSEYSDNLEDIDFEHQKLLQIDLSDQENGYYIIRIISEENVYLKTLIIQ